MSILSDKEIKELCEVNTFVYDNGVTSIYFNENNYEAKLQGLFDIEVLKGILGSIAPGTSVKQAFNNHGLQHGLSFSNISISRLLEPTRPMISPFVDKQVRNIKESDNQKVISFGTSSYGYDIRIAPEFKVFSNLNSVIIDPKNFDDKAYMNFTGDVCIIPPHSFVLTRSIERFVIPRDITIIVLNKSTYARCGINCLASPLESEWEGYVTLEYSNNSSLPAKLYANEGGAQLLCFRGKPCDVSYADRSGKYQHQGEEIVLPKV